MNEAWTRRHFLAAGAAGLAASAVAPTSARGQLASVRWAALTPGFTVLPVQYILANKLGQKNGLDLPDPAPYTAVSTYYNDFIAGNYDVCIGSWDTFASRYNAGVPLQYLCTITNAEMIAILASQNGPKDVTELKGKVFAALQATGTYRMVRAIIKEAHNIQIEKEATVQSVDNPAASVTLVMADRADAALSWEPNVTTGLLRKPDLKIIFNAGDAYRALTQRSLPYFGIAIRKELATRVPDVVAKLNNVFRECIDGINADHAKAVDLFGGRTGIAPEVMKQALGSNRLRFKFEPMADAGSRESIQKASEFLARNELLTKPVDDGFFAV